MTTKPPSPVQEAQPHALEKIAYASVSTIPTQEPNDQNRLGYHVWRWLQSKEGSLEQAIKESGARLTVSQADALNVIREVLMQHGISS